MIQKNVRTGEHHGFSEEESLVDQFEVVGVYTDFAQRALLEAQDKFFHDWPNSRKHASKFLWQIRKLDEPRPEGSNRS